MRNSLRINLQTRYSMQIMLIILASMLCLSALSVWHLSQSAREVESVTSSAIENHLEEQLRERARVMTEYLAQNLGEALLALDLQSMHRQLQTATSQPDVRFVFVYDKHGEVVHDGSRAIGSFGEPLDELLGWRASSVRAAQARRMGKDLQFARPISLGNEFIGGIAVVMSMEVIAAETRGLRHDLKTLNDENLQKEVSYSIAFTLIFMLAGALLALVAGRRLASPIRVLATHAGQLGRGEFEEQIEVRRNDEIGDLASAFRSMQKSLEANQEKIRFLAYHDSLTGLQNRANMVRTLDKLCQQCREEKTIGAVLFIDLDDFKPVNDTLGHEAGDEVLKAAAERLLECLSSPDARRHQVNGDGSGSVARLGGDEFTVMLARLDDPGQAERVAQEILEALCKPFSVDGREIFIGASIGIACCPEDGRDAESLLARADVAMYHAKRRGKHASMFFEEHMLQETRDKLFLINDLRSSLNDDGLTVHYQPIVATASGRVVGAEALVRWHHPRRGLIKASEFVEVAEKSGEIERLGQWALERVCSDIAQWRKNGLEGLFVSINISSQQLLRADLSDYLTGALSQWGLGPRDLRIEASENRFFSGNDQAMEILQGWHQSGFDIWIDNFGTGSASLLNLLKVPARGLKLDPNFIRNVTTDDRLRNFVRSIIELAAALQLEVCAVGVNSQALAEWLRDNGCRYLQGHYLGPVLSASDFLRHLDFAASGGGSGSALNLKAG